MDWHSLAGRKRDSVLSQIPPQWLISLPSTQPTSVAGTYIQGYLPSKVVEITETDTGALVKKLSDGSWTALEVTEAFCQRAAVSHQLLPCLTEVLFAAALQRASKLDTYFREHGKPVGPLHGLPISLKDQVNIEGVDSATGVVSYIGNGPGNKDAEIVRSLYLLGAIPFVKTTVPQFSFAFETENNITGYIFNPFNRKLSAGGSSGGEGALLALRGSPLGLGTDIGGSIRVPSAFCGLYGLKPTTTRLPFLGVKRVGDGQASGTPFAIGPMATSADVLALTAKALLSQEPWLHDTDVVSLPWREDLYRKTVQAARGESKRMVFGIFEDNGIVRPQPPVQRALEMTVAALRRQGHEILEWDPPNHTTAVNLVYKTFTLDGGHEVLAGLAASGEPATGPTTALFGTKPVEEATATSITETNKAIKQYRKQYLDYWNEKKVDAVIAPVSPHAAPEIGKFKHFDYTIWVNLLDYSAAVIPVTRADQDLDVYPAGEYTPLSEQDGVCRHGYDPKVFHGAPVGLQIIGRRFEEEKVCALAEVLGAAVAKEEDIATASRASL